MKAMGSTLRELYTSKRFLLTVLAILVCASFVLAGKLPLTGFLDLFTKLTALLTTLYGLENAAAALKSGITAPLPALPSAAAPPATPPPAPVAVAPPPAATPPPVPPAAARKVWPFFADALGWIAAGIVSVLPVLVVVACAASAPTPAQQATVGDYAGEQLACVERYDTRAEVHACRDAVKAKFGRLDAGAGAGGGER
jgi:hypothetical protein